MKTFFSTLLMFFFCINFVFSQKAQLVVLDELSNKPVEFSSVGVFLMPDSTLIASGNTDSLGRFEFTLQKEKCFYLLISNLSYKSVKTKEYCQGEILNPIEIKLKSSSKKLAELTIESQKNLFKLEGEKKVFDVGGSIAAVSGTAAQVLAQVPTVNVDMDGNVSVRGNPNVIILIDGKPSGITGSSRQAVLDQIPAANIDKVEVISNPSSRYDAEGMAGIINIVLKQNKDVGYNSSLTLGAGTNHKYNANISTSIKRRNFNIGVFYTFRKNPIWGYVSDERKNNFADTSFFIKQYTNSKNDNLNHNLRLTSEINFKKNVSFSYSLSGSNQSKSENEYIQYFNYSPFDIYRSNWVRTSLTNSKTKNAETTFFLKKAFAQKGCEFSLSGNASYNESFSTGNYQNIGLEGYPSTFNSSQINPINSIFRIGAFQSDFTKPISKDLKFDAGLKISNRNIATDFSMLNRNNVNNEFETDLNLSNQFRYNEIVSAAYFIGSGNIKKINYQLGTRVENTNLAINQLTIDSSIVRNFTNVFPNINFNYPISKKHEFQLAFSKRLNRPSPQSLNPFSDYADPLNVRTGNPYLRPEYIYATEATYSNRNKWGAVIITGYFRHISNSMQRYRSAFRDGRGYVTIRNFSFAQNTGAEFIWRADPLKSFNFTANFNLYYTKIKGGSGEGDLTNDNFNYNFKLISSIKLFSLFDLQVTGIYNARTILLQGYFGAIYGLDLGLKRDVFKNRGSITFNISDVFNTRQMQIYTKGDNFESFNKRKRETLIANLAFTYKIGQSESNPSKKKNSGKENQQMDMNNDMGW